MINELPKIFYTTNTISHPAEIASALVPVVQNCTSTEFPETLIDYVGEVATKQPRDIETICKVLSILLGDPQIQEKRLDGPGCSMIDGLGDVFAEDGIGNLSIDSTNVCLTTALLSASAIKHNLQHVDQRIPQAIVLLGLQDPDPRLMPKPKKNEVYGVVALIHLAVIGDKMAEKVERRLSMDGGIKNALESLKRKHVFKSLSVVELLKHVIANVESGYKKNISENEVWDLLFPTEGFLCFLGGPDSKYKQFQSLVFTTIINLPDEFGWIFADALSKGGCSSRNCQLAPCWFS